MGHIARKCNTRFKKAHRVDDGAASDLELEGELYEIYTVTDKSKEIKDTITIDGCPLSMDTETRASVTVVSERFYKQYLAHMQLNPTAKGLRSYSSDTLKVLGEVDVNTTYKEQQARLPLVVIAEIFLHF